ncbi:hypothetical protein, partial [Streptomyces afghaniensis]|uniref:hypothetical protein n=1 Tax=Streptomyces afghaniensis TaxID=66865 RepID=UPI002468B820
MATAHPLRDPERTPVGGGRTAVRTGAAAPHRAHHRCCGARPDQQGTTMASSLTKDSARPGTPG